MSARSRFIWTSLARGGTVDEKRRNAGELVSGGYRRTLAGFGIGIAVGHKGKRLVLGGAVDVRGRCGRLAAVPARGDIGQRPVSAKQSSHVSVGIEMELQPCAPELVL